MEQILAIIPARAGSKRLEKKNIKLLCGKPLIAYTIESALASHYLNRIVISTEDEEIARISRSFGAEVIMRPLALAQDDSTTEDVIVNVLDQLKNKENYIPEILVLLQPTSPLRTTEDINNAIKIFIGTHGDSLVSITKFDHPPHWAFQIENGMLKSAFSKKSLKRSQDLPSLYRPNGALFITRTDSFIKNRSFYTKQTIPFILPRKRSIDIDDEFDFLVTEFLLNKLGEKKVGIN
jgi:CMP-N-acetylneuraminic acid synthetase